MSDKNKHRKQIAFDLDQAALKEYYPKPKFTIDPFYYKKAYKDIKRFMRKNGFEWAQFSVYESKERLTRVDVIALTNRMNKAMPWLSKCINRLTTANIDSRQHDLTGYIKGNANIERTKNYELKKGTIESSKEEQPSNLRSLKSIIENANQRKFETPRQNYNAKEKTKEIAL